MVDAEDQIEEIDVFPTEQWAFSIVGSDKGIPLINPYTDGYTKQCRLFATAQNKDIFAVAGEGGIKCGKLSDLRKSILSSSEGDDDNKPTMFDIQESVPVRFLEFSTDESKLLVSTDLQVKCFSTDVSDDDSCAPQLICTFDLKTPIVDIHKRPGYKDGFAFIDESNDVYALNVSSRKGKVRLIARDSRMFSYRPITGDQILVGTPDCNLALHKSSGELDYDIPHPSNEEDFETPRQVSCIEWYSSDNAIVVYASQDDPQDCVMYHVKIEGPHNCSWRKIPESVYPALDEMQGLWYIQSLADEKGPWRASVQIYGASFSADVGLLVRPDVDDEQPQQVEFLEDSSRATLPMTNMDDTVPLGLVLDIFSDLPVQQPVGDVESCPPLPILWAFNNMGHVCAWNILDTQAIVNSTLDLKSAREAYQAQCDNAKDIPETYICEHHDPDTAKPEEAIATEIDKSSEKEVETSSVKGSEETDNQSITSEPQVKDDEAEPEDEPNNLEDKSQENIQEHSSDKSEESSDHMTESPSEEFSSGKESVTNEEPTADHKTGDLSSQEELTEISQKDDNRQVSKEESKPQPKNTSEIGSQNKELNIFNQPLKVDLVENGDAAAKVNQSVIKHDTVSSVQESKKDLNIDHGHAANEDTPSAQAERESSHDKDEHNRFQAVKGSPFSFGGFNSTLPSSERSTQGGDRPVSIFGGFNENKLMATHNQQEQKSKVEVEVGEKAEEKAEKVEEKELEKEAEPALLDYIRYEPEEYEDEFFDEMYYNTAKQIEILEANCECTDQFMDWHFEEGLYDDVNEDSLSRPDLWTLADSKMINEFAEPMRIEAQKMTARLKEAYLSLAKLKSIDISRTNKLLVRVEEGWKSREAEASELVQRYRSLPATALSCQKKLRSSMANVETRVEELESRINYVRAKLSEYDGQQDMVDGIRKGIARITDQALDRKRRTERLLERFNKLGIKTGTECAVSPSSKTLNDMRAVIYQSQRNSRKAVCAMVRQRSEESVLL